MAGLEAYTVLLVPNVVSATGGTVSGAIARSGTALVLAVLCPFAAVPARAQETGGAAERDLVAVAVIGGGRRVLLATPGREADGRRFRFRSLDTSDLPQPFQDVTLSASGTKLFVQTAQGPTIVIDLMRQQRYHAARQAVSTRDVTVDGVGSTPVHRLPRQRFVGIRDGMAFVTDDTGAVLGDYPVHPATHGAIAVDGAAIYLRADRAILICGQDATSRHLCRESAVRVPAGPLGITTRALPGLAAGGPDQGVLADGPGESGTRGHRIPTQFLLLVGGPADTRIFHPEDAESVSPPMRRVEAALRAYLMLHGESLPEPRVRRLVDSLVKEASETSASDGEAVADWRFYRVAPDEELYAPVLQFARWESVFPGRFDTTETQGGGRLPAKAARHAVVQGLFDRYLRMDLEERRRRCTIYVRTRSNPGTWTIEYWLYYPFDVGGLGSHLHDPEHLFVEVDKLGGTVRTVIGAAHGFLAGNNIYSTDYPGAVIPEMPLFASVELFKHATATDMDRDGIFTPGLDENRYRERAKIWGLRDVMGTINNQLIAYDRTMSAPRFLESALAPLSVATRYPHEPALAARACCQLVPMPEGDERLPPCGDATAECARRSVTSHPDFRDGRTIFKEWVFPESFLRATYGLGPVRGLQSAGIGYSMDLDHLPWLGRFVSVPGRVGGELFGWRADTTIADTSACPKHCRHEFGFGVGIRYEQFLSNLFGISSSVRFYDPPFFYKDVWFTFGPMVELPLFNRSNAGIQAGVAFRPSDSPRFEMKVHLGLWKPRMTDVGMRARKGDGG
jgi:hypothetical protein